jgi:hypothetical protein
MAEQRVRSQRKQQLSFLGLEYPLWVFRADDPRWPRRLASLLPESHPAKMTGWVVSFSEYGLHLGPLRDLSDNNEDTKSVTRNQRAKLAQAALEQLRYDDTYDIDSVQVVSEDHGEQFSKSLSTWAFDSHNRDWIDLTAVLRIERMWDRVPLWDPPHGLATLSDAESVRPVTGIATCVANDELVFIAGTQESDNGEEIRKAESQCLDASVAGPSFERCCLPTQVGGTRR